MRVGIDLQVLSHRPWTGVGNYAFNLTKELLKLETKHEFVLFVPPDLSPASLPHLERGEVIRLPKKSIPFWSAHVTYARVMQKAKLDVLHGPANVLPWFYPSPPPFLPHQWGGSEGGGRSQLVITIHDLAIYLHPEWFPRGQTFSTKFLVPRSIKKADAIIVPSEVTKKDLIDLFKVPERKIAVIPEGVEERFFTPSSSPPVLVPEIGGEKRGGYILFVGTLEPRKNVRRLLEAYAALPEDIRAEYELWIAGEKGWETPSFIPPSLREGGETRLPARPGEGVKFLGYVPDEELPALYQSASVFVYPSLYEGFGLPVLEAMAAGVPVVTSKGTAMEELVTSPALAGSLSQTGKGEGEVTDAAVLIDPLSPSDISRGITKLIRDDAYASQISRAGEERTRDFTWVKAARRTLEVYQVVSKRYRSV